jgi:hypothetical protein
MKTEELIDSLVLDAKPVRRLPSPVTLAAGLVLCALAASMTGAWFFGIRADLADQVFSRRFIMINTMLLMTLGAAALALSTLAIPGRKRRLKVQAVFGAATVAVLIGMFLMRWPWFHGMGWGAWFSIGAYCTLRALLLGALPTAAGMWLHRHGAPMNPGISGGLIGGAAGSQGANAMGWACEVDEPMHVLVWHFLLPTALLAAAGIWAGRRWLRW